MTTPYAELARAAAEVQSWHEPALHAKNQAPRKCKECGFTWPCRTYLRLETGAPAMPSVPRPRRERS